MLWQSTKHILYLCCIGSSLSSNLLSAHLTNGFPFFHRVLFLEKALILYLEFSRVEGINRSCNGYLFLLSVISEHSKCICCKVFLILVFCNVLVLHRYHNVIVWRNNVIFIWQTAVFGEFVGYSEVDFVYKLGRHEVVACSSFYTNSDNEGIPISVSPCSTRPRGKFVSWS